MSYGEPPEWHGQGTDGREGWPTYGEGGYPDAPGSHRHRPDPQPYYDNEEPYQEPIADTSLRPPEPPVTHHVQWRPVIHVFERQKSILATVRDMALISACLVILAVGGMVVAHHGVPLWMP